MYTNILNLVIPIICLFMNVVTQVIFFRYIPWVSLLKSLFFGFGIGLITVAILECYILFTMPVVTRDFVAILLVDLITYSSLGYCYFHFINMGETARRIRILLELYDSKEGLSFSQILERYNAKEILEKRLSRLINNRQIVFKEGVYYIGTPVILLISKIIVAMKRLILCKDFYDFN